MCRKHAERVAGDIAMVADLTQLKGKFKSTTLPLCSQTSITNITQEPVGTKSLGPGLGLLNQKSEVIILYAFIGPPMF